MENSTSPGTTGNLQDWCMSQSHQEHLPGIIWVSFITNSTINSISSCVTVIGNVLILISLTKTSRVNAASKALHCSLAGVWSRDRFVCPASLRSPSSGGKRRANGHVQADGKHYQCRWCHLGRCLSPDSVGHQRGSSARHSSQDSLQGSRNCNPNESRFGHLLVL